MEEHGDEKRRKRRGPFDDIFDGLFDNREFEKMFEEMQKYFADAFSGIDLGKIQPGKPFVHGFSLKVGPDGKPRMEEFGNRTRTAPTGEIELDEREPLTDIIEGDKEVSVTVELPGVERSDIDLKVTEDGIEIKVDTPQRKYRKRLPMPCEVNPKTTKATYKNGILDVVIQRKEPKKKGEGEGFRVNIE
ncbi:MAG: hypothetical protein CVT48_06225 [Thermoplasmata archaeon HGW-Thermoplasmata-1]|nr:MAG: hypothetical protein CVT48_06225 [Thermoplasmata archaeon HGW-Thermoplasmata-1]